jgi:glucans biosynthesis protein C
MAHSFKPLKLAPVTEGLILVVLTFCISFGVFEVVRRIGVLRPLFGLGRRPAKVPQAYQPEATAV